MSHTVEMRRPPLGVRLLHALRKEPDWLTMPAEALDAFRDAENRRRASSLARLITGFPDRRARIDWQQLTLPDRVLPVRVYRSSSERDDPAGLPLVLHVHGGGFVGTAVQSDWVNSHLACRLPAVVVSVEHRLVAPGVSLAAAVDDGWDVLNHVVRHAARWRIDPTRVAVFGESAGSVVAALAAIRARESDLMVRAQVLVNPCVDLTSTAFDYASMDEHASSPILTVPQLELFRRLAAPEGTDPRAVSPLFAGDLSGLAPALVVVPTHDPLADHGRTYARRLREAGTPAQLTEHPGATHAFLSMPGVVPQARSARTEIVAFLRDRLAG
ncbi:alpha/beta hydrolase [Verrucosispora sioxanthis]|uniref:Alpha/beta hydrolase n=1 Tax=Verrucosispora sioxanthis TaxID=2499994 RepID=A0A6M1KWX5_9ACTN|nr:alpha/beta hydrolase [Verrucosispora sioxanthis]NEE63359.1 alpha/beta hydrolase [Verrucosispora sioxanthis]NGM12469.1 alpha/beta hydrolase [Verrucosispora sioxanthis]